ncbi:3853_t:CDS:2 [Acaulospora morrowiae]|uniref:3853_t:CDS:1 n=1 Tax=Acaulospora morrowiae TaxID=94023 RepID=A0A9N9H4A2_9GLOM|nr:3853_t:CDS:2 [Acaulospora morrowiae]
MPSTIDILNPYDISEDILTIKANVIYGQLLKYTDQRRNFSKILKRAKPTVVATLDIGAAVSIITKKLLDKLHLEINEKSTSVIITVNGMRERTLEKAREERDTPTGDRLELKVPISYNGIEGLAYPDEVEANDYESGDVFDEWEYESEEGLEEKGYYTEERSEGEEATLEEILSPAIHLAALEEVPTWEEGELTIEEPKMDLDNLSEEKRREVVKLFETKDELFTRELDELTQTNVKRAKSAEVKGAKKKKEVNNRFEQIENDSAYLHDETDITNSNIVDQQ